MRDGDSTVANIVRKAVCVNGANESRRPDKDVIVRAFISFLGKFSCRLISDGRHLWQGVMRDRGINVKRGIDGTCGVRLVTKQVVDVLAANECRRTSCSAVCSDCRLEEPSSGCQAPRPAVFHPLSCPSGHFGPRTCTPSPRPPSTLCSS